MSGAMHEEQEALGTLMCGNGVYHRYLIGLRPYHFVDPVHAVIYDDIVRRIEVGEHVDAIVLRDVYRAQGVGHWFGRPDAQCEYLAQLLTAYRGQGTAERMRTCKSAIIAAWRERMEVSARFWTEGAK